MKYERIQTVGKYDCTKTLAYFTTLYAMRKSYSGDCAAEMRFESAANIAHTSPEMSASNASINLNRGGIMGVLEDEAMATYHDYFKGLEESLADEK